MKSKSFKVAVALLAFNRPEKTRQVFEKIRQIKPPILLVSADGPRQSHPEDIEKCAAVRRIFSTIDWPCELVTNFSAANLGSYRKNSDSLTWIFDTVDEAIILEDDCIPEQSFFYFCSELLERYRHDERVMLISGNNFQFGHGLDQHSYFFSRYIHTWGWAAWKRTWRSVDLSMHRWPEFNSLRGLESLRLGSRSTRYWKGVFQNMYAGKRRFAWDYQLQLALFMENGLAISPSANLVKNIGFDQDSVHHKNRRHILCNVPTSEMEFPLKHPPFVLPGFLEDQFISRFRFSLPRRAIRKARLLLDR